MVICSYLLYHASRKSLSTVKGTVIQIWTDKNFTHYNSTNSVTEQLFTVNEAERFMGVLDFTFELAYAIVREGF